MNHELYLRCHARVLDNKPRRTWGKRKPSSDLKYVLLLDTETTTDTHQSLNFGAYQFCEADSDGNFLCLEEGLFYADDLGNTHVDVLRKYVRSENRKKTGTLHSKLKLHTRSAFVEKVMYVAIQAGAAI